MKLLYHPAVLEHLEGVTHPENAGRLQAFRDLPAAQNLPEALDYIPLVHPQDYIETIRSHSRQGLSLDPDTHTTAGSFTAATTAVSLAIEAYRQRNFALGRPPGHHAYRQEAHGFCLFNQIAIATQFARQEHERVLILDFDGHLGDGTMDIFYQHDQVLYWSLHQYPAYPGNGSATEIGAGAGKGFTINCPLPPGSGDDLFVQAIETMLPAAKQFNPDIVAVSAGFDAHQHDPLLQLRASEHFFYWIGQVLHSHFEGKVFAVLEGGYNPEALTAGIHHFLAGINGETLDPITPTRSAPETRRIFEQHLEQALTSLKPYWSSL